MKGGHLAIIDDPVGVKSVREVEAVCPRAAGRIGRLSWSPDSRLVAAASRGDASCERTLEVLEAVSLKRVDIASIPAVTTATFSPDGRTLAVGTEREVRLLPMRPGGLSATMPVADSVQALAWSQDGLLAFSTDDGTVQLMHPDGTVVWKTRVTYYASSVAFLPGEDGVFIITVDGQWWKLSLTDGAVLFRSELTDWAPSMAAAQSLGAFLLGGSTGSAFLRAADGSVLEVIRFEESGPGYVSVSSDGTTLALAGRMAGSVGERRTSVSLFRIGAGSGGVGFTGHTSSIYHLTVAQDGLYSGSMDGTVRRWHADDASAGGEVVADLRDQSAVIDSIAVDRDAAHLAVVTIRGAVEVWDLKEKKRLRRLREGEATNRIDHGIAFSPDGGMLAVGLGKVLVRWSTADWSELPELRGHEGDIWRVAFSADGNWIATGATDATARLWPTQGGEPKVLRLVKDGTVSGVDFSPDSKELLACATDAKCQIFDVASGKVRVELAGHRLWVNLGVFSPDGKLILTGSDDQTARLWDRRTGRLLRILSAHEQVIAVAFSKDSRWVFFNDREVVRRVPAVPGPTDSAATLLDRAERAAGMRLEGLELVPIHR
jgi:WD40 repeat protein